MSQVITLHKTGINTFESLYASDFEEISADEYEETVLDWRFEDGEWRQ